jgi:hypothetical protein
MSRFNSLNIVCSVLAVGSFFVVPNVLAQNSCKGMAEDKCLSDQACRWVGSYQRKDGRTVKAHCRTQPKKKAVEIKPLVEANK